jgi:glycosyltransferase involved in cell wall biosynthesis
MSKNANVGVLKSFGMGCDLNRFDKNNINKQRIEELREELNLTKDDFVYIFIGRQTNFKGFDKVIRAFLQTLETHPNSKLLLVGEKDRIHPTSLKPKYEKEIVSNPAIIKVGWQENVQDYLALSDLNVFPSEREGLPVNLMESLAVGVPVITVNSRGCKEVVRNEVDGIVLEKYEIEDIARSMRKLQDDKVTLAKYAQNAIQGRNRFDRKAFIENQFEIFERLVGKPV